MPAASLRVAALLGASGVLVGAFGAHALRGKVEDKMLKTWETATQYHLIHAVAILALPAKKSAGLTLGLLTTGVLLFSGSLYAMVLTDNRKLGIVTPIGGIIMTIGWLTLLI